MPSVNTVGEAMANVVLDGDFLVVVPDAVQSPEVIVGRSWLDHHKAYHKAHGHLYIYNAEAIEDGTAVGAANHDKRVDYLPVVEVDRDPLVRQMLVLSDPEFVNAKVPDSSPVACTNQLSARISARNSSWRS